MGKLHVYACGFSVAQGHPEKACQPKLTGARRIGGVFSGREDGEVL
ncbi:MAG: hypothetical protein K2I96_00190 [Lachnospiraceae bacterium]|nr:hypothetical protein [Lachnospiraceae bacterium]